MLYASGGLSIHGLSFKMKRKKKKQDSNLQTDNCSSINCGAYAPSSRVHSGQPNPSVLNSHVTQSKGAIPRSKRRSLSSHCLSANLALLELTNLQGEVASLLVSTLSLRGLKLHLPPQPTLQICGV